MAMSDVLIRRDLAARARGGRVASWLGFAAAPTFAAMALWTGLFNGQSNMLCMGMPDASPLSGMAPMYALMSAFHAGPWLKLIVRR
jgi:hypothetical protein